MFAGGAGGEARELPLSVAEEGKSKVLAFQAYLPLIAAVCNPGLRERHWEALAELVGFTIKQDEVRCIYRLRMRGRNWTADERLSRKPSPGSHQDAGGCCSCCGSLFEACVRLKGRERAAAN